MSETKAVAVSEYPQPAELGEVESLVQKLLDACERIDDADLRKRVEHELALVFTSRSAPTLINIPKGSFYEIQDHIQALFDSIEGMEDSELRKEAEADLARWFEAEVRKVDSINAYLHFCASQQQMNAREAERARKAAETWKNRHERTRDGVKRVMEMFGHKKLAGRTATFSLRPSGGSVIIQDENALPSDYVEVTVTRVPKKDEIKRAIRAGIDVPGADLSMGGETLYIT